jgi:hypothetical protein
MPNETSGARRAHERGSDQAGQRRDRQQGEALQDRCGQRHVMVEVQLRGPCEHRERISDRVGLGQQVRVLTLPGQQQPLDSGAQFPRQAYDGETFSH